MNFESGSIILLLINVCF